MNGSVKKNVIARYIAPMIVLLGVTFAIFYQAVDVSLKHIHNAKAFESFSNGMEGYIGFKLAWKPRLFSNALATQFVSASDAITASVKIPRIEEPLQLAVGLWTAGWFFLMGMMYIAWMKSRSVFYIVGMFAGVSFGYLPIGADRIYPWDMTALFIFTAFVILFVKNKFAWMFPLIALGMGFKETAFILCFAFLLKDIMGGTWNIFSKSFWTQIQKPTWVWFALTLVCSALVKISIDRAVMTPSPFMTMEYTYGGQATDFYFYKNLMELFTLRPFLVNAGMLCAFFIIPSSDNDIRALKVLAALFTLGNFSFGLINEYRIWFEMIPFALYSLDSAFYGTIPTDARMSA